LLTSMKGCVILLMFMQYCSLLTLMKGDISFVYEQECVIWLTF